MARNGWISVYDDERPKSGEQVLTISYGGEKPVPKDVFANPEHRHYRVLTYFNAGDVDPLANLFFTVVFKKDGFYLKEEDLLSRSTLWRRRATIAENAKHGVAFWKHLDYPTTD